MTAKSRRRKIEKKAAGKAKAAASKTVAETPKNTVKA